MTRTGRPRPRLLAALNERPLLMVTLGMLLYSTGPVLVPVASVSGSVLSFWRLWIGAAVLGVAVLVQHLRTGIRATARGWWWAAVAGVVFGSHQAFFMTAIKATSVVDVTLMQVLAPLLVGAMAVVVFGERPGTAFRVWSLVAVAGSALVVLAGTTGPRGDAVGMAFAVANVVLFAVYFVLSKQAMEHIAALPYLFGVAVLAGLALSLVVLVLGEPVGAATRQDLLVAALIAVVPGALGHFVSTHPLSRVAANIPPVIQLGMPFIAGSLAWLLFDQPVTLLHVVGGLVTMGGVVGALLSPGGRRLAAPARRRPADAPGGPATVKPSA